MGSGSGTTLGNILSGDLKAPARDVESLFKQDTEANILTGGAVGITRQAIRDFGPGEGLDDPKLPDIANLPTEEQTQAAAKRKRDFERIRRSGFQGRASTIKTGPQGAGANIQTTFKQLRGR